MSPSPLIALTTDFGPNSTYVAQLKGVIYSRLPTAHIVDVTHALAPGDIVGAELHLRGTAYAFPLGTTHIVVVDPGVGTKRRGIAVEAAGMFFVGPDNGVLGEPAARAGAQVVTLDNPSFFVHPVSPTFHGRDIFTPVAVELAAGLPLLSLGSPVSDAVASGLPPADYAAGSATGVTLGVDRFGNLTTNLSVKRLDRTLGAWRATVDGQATPRYTTYGDADPGTLIVLEGSDGYLELAVPNGSAAERLGQARDIRIECVTA